MPSAGQTLEILSLKSEVHQIFDARRVFIDAIVRAGESLYVLPFLDCSDASNPVIPFRLRGLERECISVIEAGRSWYDASGKPDGPNGRVFAMDDDLRGVAFSTDPLAISTGISSLSALQALLDRYGYARSHGHGRSILDWRAGLGQGAFLLQDICAELYSHSSEAMARAARRLGRDVRSEDPEQDFDVVLAFALDAQTARDEVARARRFLKPDGILLASILGEHCEEFSSLGRTEIFVGPAGDFSHRYQETLLWIEPRTHRQERPPEVAASVTAAQQKLSVLFVLRSNAAEFPGGDSNQVYRTAQALQARGHRVEVTLEEEPDARGFDIVHLSNMTIPHDTLRAARAVAPYAPAIVLMPIFIDHADEGVWGYRAEQWAFAYATDEHQLQEFLGLVRARGVGIQDVKPPPERSEMEPGYFEAQRQLLQLTDYLIANAYSEVHRIYRFVDERVPFSLAPSCTDGAVYGRAARDRFVQRYGIEDFVLMTGRFEARKNQVVVAHMLRDSGIPLVMIGRNQYAPYGELLRMYWPQNLTVYRFMPEEELAGAYAAARVLAIPSWDEVVSLSCLNGALSETSLVLSRNGYEHEYVGADAHYCDPGDAFDIAKAIKRAWSQHPERKAQLADLAARIRDEYTWEHSAELTEAAYYRILADNPRGRARLAAAS